MTEPNRTNTVPDKTVRFCFVCGARMNETWRANEPGGAYVWYECSRESCDQTYLVREHTHDGPVFNELTCKA